MKIAILCSKQDEAGLNIHSFLVNMIKPEMEKHEVSLHLREEDSIYMEYIDRELDCDFIIFATKHQSKSGVKSLSVHTQGNWGRADFGGREGQLGIAPASWLKEAMNLLKPGADELGFELIQECTHHGPYTEVPSFFIEIGSSKDEWSIKRAGEIIAITIVQLIEMDIPDYKSAVGIGGLHHTPSFKKIILNTDIAIGHVCPKYNLKNLNKEMLIQALEKTIPKAELVIVDWKGVGEHKERIKALLEEMDIEWKKTKSKDFEI